MTGAVSSLQAQVVASPSGTTVVPAVPKATCPCDNPNFKPLTEKARAVQAYWEARRDYNVASTIAGTAALFALFTRSGGLMNEAQNTLSNAENKLFTARTKAESLKGIKLTDGDDKTVQIKLEKGVDYTL